MTDIRILRLHKADAPGIVDCFKRVYGDSYANELFYDPDALSQAIAVGRVGSVGARTADGTILGHMAMTVHADADVVELGNSVVDPAARGKGLAWKVGAELSTWCRELGYQGFVHYPTTDHHIMQRQSVKAGFEVGLMLGYIPEETHGKVGEADRRGRQAATIVYEPYWPGQAFEGFVPDEYADLLTKLAHSAGLPRTWRISEVIPSIATKVELSAFPKRGLDRASITQVGGDLADVLGTFSESVSPCLQIDLSMTDPAIGYGLRIAKGLGFRFCGWLPGYRRADVLRLQRVDADVTDLSPALENRGARDLLEVFLADV
jgi:GNAT superfamily N-acetyltransferase